MTGLKAWHLVVSHLGVVLIAALAIVAWYGWTRPVQNQYLKPTVVNVPVGETKVVPIVVNGQTVPQTVTAPSPTVRIITSPAAPVIVTPAQGGKAEQAANIVVQFDETRRCVHPDVRGVPDPTCGAPVHPHVVLVQNGGGFVRLSSPDDDLQTGPIQTTFNKVTTQANVHRFDATIATGASSLFNGVTYARAELRYHPLQGVLQPVYVGASYRHFYGGPVQSEGALEIGATFSF